LVGRTCWIKFQVIMHFYINLNKIRFPYKKIKNTSFP
jgi:hypothetical protein